LFLVVGDHLRNFLHDVEEAVDAGSVQPAVVDFRFVQVTSGQRVKVKAFELGSDI
jgi:hypothetical protein